MPVYTKKQLRRTLAQRWIHDLAPYPPQSSGFNVFLSGSPVKGGNVRAVDMSASGQNLYLNSWLYIEGSVAVGDTAGTFYQYAVASFDYANGVYYSDGVAVDYHNATSVWEVHTRISPMDKEMAIDDTIKRIRIRQEVVIPTVDGALFYPIDAAASPFGIDEILDVHIYSNPSGTQDRGERPIGDWDAVMTATGREFRLKSGVAGSQGIVFDAILIPSLGGELATLNIPDERWILAGAAARCYDFLIQAAPAQQVAMLTQRRQEAAMEFSRLSTRFQPVYDRPIRFHETSRSSSSIPGGFF